MNHQQISEQSEDEEYSQVARAAAASRCTWMSVIVNIALSCTQIVVGVMSKSQGLVADGIHSLSDLIADFVVLFASHKSKEDADEGHPYGHLRFETAASMVLGILLLIVGVGMIGSAVFKLEPLNRFQRYTLRPYGLPSQRWWPKSCCFALCCGWPKKLSLVCWLPMPGTQGPTPPPPWLSA